MHLITLNYPNFTLITPIITLNYPSKMPPNFFFKKLISEVPKLHWLVILIHKFQNFQNFIFGASGRFRAQKNSKIFGCLIFLVED